GGGGCGRGYGEG
ncbi:hypothetical protein A2U01_0118548, partial [Trifolium medium]|nr:hypothetical protein [Trifolium medium]